MKNHLEIMIGTEKFEVRVGDVVWDDLTQKDTTILSIEYPTKDSLGTTIYVNDQYLGGMRFPWEISKPNANYKSVWELKENQEYYSTLKERIYKRIGDVLYYKGQGDTNWQLCKRSLTKFWEK